MTTQNANTGPVQQLRQANAALVQQIESVTDAVEQVGRADLETAVSRLQMAVTRCNERRTQAVNDVCHILSRLTDEFVGSHDYFTADLLAVVETKPRTLVELPASVVSLQASGDENAEKPAAKKRGRISGKSSS